VVTNVIFALLAAASVVSETSNRIIFYGVNVGAIGFIVGLVSESSTMKRIFTPILGLTLLYGIYVHLTAKPVTMSDRVAVEG
jgi:predicted membrane protein